MSGKYSIECQKCRWCPSSGVPVYLFWSPIDLAKTYSQVKVEQIRTSHY